jgi:hypothetical protein
MDQTNQSIQVTARNRPHAQYVEESVIDRSTSMSGSNLEASRSENVGLASLPPISTFVAVTQVRLRKQFLGIQFKCGSSQPD